MEIDGYKSKFVVLENNTNLYEKLFHNHIHQTIIIAGSEEEAKRIAESLNSTGFIEAEYIYDFYIPREWTVIFRYYEKLYYVPVVISN